MKLINQSFEILEQKDFTLKGIKQFIERCARVSYKSENRMTDSSYEKFVGMLESRDHARPLEFGTVHLRMSNAQFETLQTLLMDGKVYSDYWIEYNIIDTEDEDNCYVTTNYRYYLEMCKYAVWLPMHLDKSDSPLYPKRYTVHMILDRGVMDEFRTHVGLSHLAESTRYCNYSKDKFNNEVTFIIPCWVNTHCPNKEGEGPSIADTEWSDAMDFAEKYYFSLLVKGWTPQQARSVLPLGVKSELISCGFSGAWENFFYRRDAKDAHPMAQEIAKPIHEEFIKRKYINERI
jgi:thymidylate synthase (FAD)